MIYAFAMNEYKWRKITLHRYEHLIQAAVNIRLSYPDLNTAATDYKYHVMCKELLELWAKANNYKIYWSKNMMVSDKAGWWEHEDDRSVVDSTTK